MENVLDLYCLPYDPDIPLICMDEQPRQLIAETRVPISESPGCPKKYDHEYERKGTANIFMFTEPLGGWRRTNVRERRTAVDWAFEIWELLEIDYPDAKKIRLVSDNLNTHKIASLYEAFEPQHARRLAKRLELHFTPKHGSWLNIAEIELSVLTKQCLNRRIPQIDLLSSEVQAWSNNRNKMQRGVNWQFTTSDARRKLKRLYPQILV